MKKSLLHILTTSRVRLTADRIAVFFSTFTHHTTWLFQSRTTNVINSEFEFCSIHIFSEFHLFDCPLVARFYKNIWRMCLNLAHNIHRNVVIFSLRNTHVARDQNLKQSVHTARPLFPSKTFRNAVKYPRNNIVVKFSFAPNSTTNMIGSLLLLWVFT